MPDYKNPLVPKKDKQKKPTYNFTAYQLDQLKTEYKRQGQAEAIPVMMAMYSVAHLLSLNAHRGYGVKRMKDDHDHLQKTFAALRDGDISYSDAAQALIDDYGVNLMIESPDGRSLNASEVFKTLEKAKYSVKMEVKK